MSLYTFKSKELTSICIKMKLTMNSIPYPMHIFRSKKLILIGNCGCPEHDHVNMVNHGQSWPTVNERVTKLILILLSEKTKMPV